MCFLIVAYCTDFLLDAFEITMEVVMTIFNYLFLYMSVLSRCECTDFLVDNKELRISVVATENFSNFSSVTYFW